MMSDDNSFIRNPSNANANHTSTAAMAPEEILKIGSSSHEVMVAGETNGASRLSNVSADHSYGVDENDLLSNETNPKMNYHDGALHLRGTNHRLNPTQRHLSSMDQSVATLSNPGDHTDIHTLGHNLSGADDAGIATAMMDGSPLGLHAHERLAVQTTYADYPVTISLLLLIHVLFAYQWNARTSKKRITVTYKQLVQRRRYHRVIVAFLSHPSRVSRTPITNRAESTDTRPTSSLFTPFPTDDGNGTEPAPSQSATQSFHRMGRDAGGRMRASLSNYIPSLLPGGHLSGLPLLFYNSHILWKCRALEVWYSKNGNFPWRYACVLFALTAVAIALEVWATYGILQILRHHSHGVSSPIWIDDRPSQYRQRASSNQSVFISEREKFLTNKQMGSLAITACALLQVYGHVFPYASYPFLPFLPEGLPLLSNSTLSYMLCMALLLAFSMPTHSITCIIFGWLSGYLWSLGITSFFKETYWGCGLIGLICMLVLVSLKVNGWSAWIPCIDYVSWDSSGYDLDPQTGLRYNASHDEDSALTPSELNSGSEHSGMSDSSPSETSSNNSGDHSLDRSVADDDYDIEMANRQGAQSSRRQRHRRSQQSQQQHFVNRGPNATRNQMRHQIPIIGDMDDEFDDADDVMVPRFQDPASSIRSRRGGNTSR